MSSVQDTLFIAFWIVLFAIGAVVGVLVFSQIGGAISGAFSGVEPAQDVFTNWNNFLPSFFSWVFTVIFVALPLIGLGLAFLVPIDVFWWWVFAAMSVLILAFGWMLETFWGWLMAVDLMADAASQITVLDFILGNYSLYTVFVLAVIGLGTYYKSGRQSGYNQIPGGFR